MTEERKKLGYKQITKKNWMEPDEPSIGWTKFMKDGNTEPLVPEDWVGAIMEPALDDGVPETIHNLFEVARGSMVYGIFFYPLFTLAWEQLFRIYEPLVDELFERHDGLDKIESFRSKVRWLEANGHITERQMSMLFGVWELRNFGSHPDDQVIITPGMAVQGVHNAAERFNELYRGLK